MRIAVVGGGPAGLYFALLAVRRPRTREIVVFEQNPPGATYGFGVVFADQALSRIEDPDPDCFALWIALAERWNDQTIVHRGERVVIDGLGYVGISRLGLVETLRAICAERGVEIRYETRIEGMDDLEGFDLVVAADGVNSAVRAAVGAPFGSELAFLDNRFAWFGTRQSFDTHTLTFRKGPDGGVFVAHHYRYSPEMSTFLVECDAQTWNGTWTGAGAGAGAGTGLAAMTDEARRRLAEAIFAEDLGGHGLVSNNSIWRRFPVVTNRRWTHGNVALIGDAARSAHFSIGSGTRLAIEDAIALDAALAAADTLGEGLARYEAERRPVAQKLADAGRRSYLWFEDMRSRMELGSLELVRDYLMRSGRMTPDRLRREAPRLAGRLWPETDADARAGAKPGAGRM